MKKFTDSLKKYNKRHFGEYRGYACIMILDDGSMAICSIYDIENNHCFGIIKIFHTDETLNNVLEYLESK